MEQGLKNQFLGALLVVLTLTAIICAGVNYQQQMRYHLPDDGATWMDTPGRAGSVRVVAVYVQPGGPADRAGIRRGDVLLRIAPIENAPAVAVRQAIDVVQLLFRTGVWGKATYTLERNGVEITARVIVADANRDRALYFQYFVGAGYLIIGLFVFFRRNRAPKALHFYLLCLASFVLHTFHYTGKLNAFDTAIYVGNVMAGLLAPALFLHFCLTFPQVHRPHAAAAGAVDLPAGGLAGGVAARLRLRRRPQLGAADRAELADRPAVAGAVFGLLPGRRPRPASQLPARCRSHPAPAAEVAAQRDAGRHRAVRPVLPPRLLPPAWCPPKRCGSACCSWPFCR